MPRITNPDWTPRYALHKRSGQARVRIPGKGEVWLPGPFGSAESRHGYDRELAAWIAAGRPGVHQPGTQTSTPAPAPPPGPAEISLVEPVAPFLHHCQSYYTPRDGSRSSTMHKVRRALALLLEMFEEIPATSFGPRELEALQGRMIGLGLSRATINGYIAIVRMLIKFGVRRQMVPAITLHALGAVDGLRKGRSPARDPGPVRPVDASTIEATIRHATPMIADMVRLQFLTGARPGELCAMRSGDIDTSRRTDFRGGQEV